MDSLDIFFKKFAYKFPKGYPDMNNEQDILLLENLISKITQENVILERKCRGSIEPTTIRDI
jgi:hypothetical protein